MNATESSPKQAYSQLEASLRLELIALQRNLDRIANLRLVSAAAVAMSALWLLIRPDPIPIVATVASAGVFVLLVVWYRRARSRRENCQVLIDIQIESLARLGHDWTSLPLRDSDPADPDHPYAVDLDVIGHGSLLHLLDTTATTIGHSALRKWLLEPGGRELIAERQHAVQELAPQRKWRQELELAGRSTGLQTDDPSPFLDWSEGDLALEDRAWLPWMARSGLAASVVMIILAIGRVFPPEVVMVPLLANVLLHYASRPIIGARIEVARSQQDAMKSYSGILVHLASAPSGPDLLDALHAKLDAHHQPAHQTVAQLGSIVSWAVPRSALSHLPLQALFSWDVHILYALERWQKQHGHQVRHWLSTIGEFEALSAMATLTYDNPDWKFPVITQSEPTINGRAVGHPLIPETTRVPNDVQIGPTGTFLLVTGSNMAGKSTMLRSIGLNIVLAQAGGPTCAVDFHLPPTTLWTCVRVTDSLEQGVSYYMAELMRLKAVHSAAERASVAEEQFCYLLDEILQGTNSAERQIAARHIISQLIELDAIGAVSTHDLQLADSPELRSRARNVHFAETLSNGSGGPQMVFDYQLKPGPATSTNALRLMEIVGFSAPEQPARAEQTP
ncbi:MutS family DNA mismatch repair protein [soil metagenome]